MGVVSERKGLSGLAVQRVHSYGFIPRLALRAGSAAPSHHVEARMTPPSETNVLLQRVARGEPGAASACIDRFGGLVWTLARRAMGRHPDIEDIVQEIFLDVWRSASRYDPNIASETAFVATIARRRLIDRARRIGRRPSEAAMVEDRVEASTTPSLGPDVIEQSSRAMEALSMLSEEQQRVLRLSVIQGLSHEKIARSTGLPLGTVKTHARRGLMKIRDILGNDAGTRGEGASPHGADRDDGVRSERGAGVRP